MPERRPADLLEIRGLNVFYGGSHALQGVDLKLEHGVLSLVGRNGMGKTTLCKAIVGLLPVASGSIRFMGEELVGRTPAEIAQLGVGYVPQGRRLWPSLTVDEHLRLAAGSGRSQWTIPRIYDAFPRLAERRTNRGNQLSGGEQQMLAISRALLLNPHLLMMDEPTEGLAPLIVEQVEEILVNLGEQGDIGVLVVEQNIGVATAVAEKVAIMINGRINRVMEAARLEADRELQQRLLGVGQHGEAEPPEEAGEASAPGGRAAAAAGARSGPRLYLEPDDADALVAAGARRPDRDRGAHAHGGSRAERGGHGAGGRPAPDHPRRRGAGHRRRNARHQGRRAAVYSRPRSPLPACGSSWSICRPPAGRRRPTCRRTMSRRISAADRMPCSPASEGRRSPRWRRRSRPGSGAMNRSAASSRQADRERSSLVAPAMQALPIGVPKVLISSVASGNVAPYVGPSDVMMLYSVTDVAGLNSVTRQILANGAAAMVGMVKARAAGEEPIARRHGTTRSSRRSGSPCSASRLPACRRSPMRSRSISSVSSFTPPASAGNRWRSSSIPAPSTGVIDITTTEVCDLLCGGVLPATEDRFGAIARTQDSRISARAERSTW